jgi:hypothetical protein
LAFGAKFINYVTRGIAQDTMQNGGFCPLHVCGREPLAPDREAGYSHC